MSSMPTQDVRVEAARLTAQVLAGSGADIPRLSAMFWTFVAMMRPEVIADAAGQTSAAGPESNGNVLALTPAAAPQPTDVA